MVAVTQFLKPDGIRRNLQIKLSRDYEKKAAQIINDGYCFECEVLSTLEVSFSISNGEEDVYIEIAEKRPGALEALEKVIDDYFADE
jgi:hypothetical protein